MKEIKLKNGMVALVDDEDYEYLNQFKWHVLKVGFTFYACRSTKSVNGGHHTILMHWDVMGGKWIDHRDHNGLNNQRSNLRFCTQAENLMNRKPCFNSKIKYKGVFPQTGKGFRSIIQVNKKQIYIGTFETPEEAAIAYDKKAYELNGDFAYLNFPELLKKHV